MNHNIQLIKDNFRVIPDYPIKGVSFKDITPVLADSYIMSVLINELVYSTRSIPDFDYVVGIESRGFIFASILSNVLDRGLVLVRKPGKLPPLVSSVSYKTEYSEETLEISKSSFPGEGNYLIVDDVLATGGSLKAASELVQELGGTIAGFLVIGQIPGLNGHKKVEDIAKVTSLFTF